MASLFDGKGASGNQPQQTQQSNLNSALAAIKQDSAGILKQAGFTIPADAAGNPNAIINHLVSSGQIPQSRLNMAQNALRRMMGGRRG